jgi:hypothetical protein
LIDRRHCQSKWQDSALVIREKINEAIQDMPAVDEIMQLLSGSCMYFLIINRMMLKSVNGL